MRLYYSLLSIVAITPILFSGCRSESDVESVVMDTDMEIRASNPDNVVLGVGQPQFVEFFSFY